VAAKKQSIVFAGGGTGGHLYPALAVAGELRRRHPGARIVFVGARRGLERRLVPAAGFPLRLLRISGLKGRSVPSRVVAALQAAWAVLRCLVWLIADRPRLVVGVGGYASGPAVLAASWLKVRTMALEQNHFPGATNRWLARRVDALCLPSATARERLGGVGLVTGNPVREAFEAIGDAPNSAALSLLVFGGSRGAHALNVALREALPRLARLDPPPRILHQTGEADLAEARAAGAGYPRGRYEARAFIDDMPERFAAADLVICRAGASTLAELAAAGRAAILVPYPHAADDHQRHNAEAVRAAGAARVLLEHELSGPSLAGAVEALAADREGLSRMGRAARTLAVPGAAGRIADVAERLLAGRNVEGAHVP